MHELEKRCDVFDTRFLLSATSNKSLTLLLQDFKPGTSGKAGLVALTVLAEVVLRLLGRPSLSLTKSGQTGS